MGNNKHLIAAHCQFCCCYTHGKAGCMVVCRICTYEFWMAIKCFPIAMKSRRAPVPTLQMTFRFPHVRIVLILPNSSQHNFFFLTVIIMLGLGRLLPMSMMTYTTETGKHPLNFTHVFNFSSILLFYFCLQPAIILQIRTFLLSECTILPLPI